MILLPPAIYREKEVTAMEWQLVIFLIIAIPVILFPVAFVWYLNIGGIYVMIKEARARRAAKKKETAEYLKSLNTKREEALEKVKALERK
jgi:hypothetical protein